MEARPDTAFRIGWLYGIGGTALLVAMLGFGIWLGRTGALGPARHLGELLPPRNLDSAARAELHRRMLRHAADMLELSDAVLVLDEGRIEQAAEQVKRGVHRFDERGATSLDAQLPPSFAVLHEQLLGDADALAAAARIHNADRIAVNYGMLTATCVKCHAQYRAGR